MRRTSRLEDGSFFSADRYFPFSFFFSTFFCHKLLVKSILKQFWWITIGLTLVGSLKWSSLFSITPLDSQKGSIGHEGRLMGIFWHQNRYVRFRKNRISDCIDSRFQTLTLFLFEFSTKIFTQFSLIFLPKRFYQKCLGTPHWNANYPVYLLHWNISW